MEWSNYLQAILIVILVILSFFLLIEILTKTVGQWFAKRSAAKKTKELRDMIDKANKQLEESEKIHRRVFI
ncbi:MAG: hypothetical protein R6V01_00645 [Thermoplasmatota archaeon]